jgi:isoleucyl-tRNA synthetase
MFKAVSPKVNIPKLEQEVLDFWRMSRVFQRSMEEREGSPVYVTYEGPPTVNGQPGVHHVLARAFKDVFPRYKTMQGYYCLRKGGWDTHGLPVEIAIEKELGFKQKREIEEYGIAEFNERCRASVLRNIASWEKFTERMAYWTDLDNAYVTFTNDYIESIWWVLRQMWDKDLIYKGYKVVPYCTRCGTPLSSHEVSLGYDDVVDPSVYVRFPLRDRPGVYFLVWTTTPWTLPGNAALAVGEDIEYVQVEGPSPDGEGTENLILAAARVEAALTHSSAYRVVKRFKGRDLLKTHYNPLYTFIPVEDDYAYVVSGDFVSTDDGTGIVHIAPAFGADDMEAGKKYNLPVLRTVNSSGHFIDAVTNFRGLWFKTADPEITRDLKERGLLYKATEYTHSYPHCWRDDTPLMYLARDSWFIRTTAYRERMIALNQTINWVPAHVRDGRFGNWLDELKDWALGRERYWGTPLPIWVDDTNGDMLCVGSVAELSGLAGRDLAGLDLHRPYVDDITFPNPSGQGGTMRRVPEVIDVWFDSGAMPVAQWGYPVSNHERFEEQFPADYICEAVDQTRGWFYTLHSISSLVFDQVSYKNVISLGLILDAEGQKMSKSKGNVVDPWDVMNQHGSDAMRWYLYTSSAAGEPRRFSLDLVGEVVKKFWSTLWNTYSFFVTYANIDGWTPASPRPAFADRDPLDRWILSELQLLVKQVTDSLDSYNVTSATRPTQNFVEALSNWYVRLSRRRFWKSESDTEKLSAYATLYECLVTISQLISPFMPFLADAIYRNLVAGQDKSAPDSVHLTTWPAYDAALVDETMLDEMRVAQKLVSLGRAARESVNIRVRQPLALAQFVTPHSREARALDHLGDLIRTELNVKQIASMNGAEDVVQFALNPLPRLLGRKFGADFPAVQKALREGDPADVRRWAQTLRAGQNIILELDGKPFEMSPDEVEVHQSAAEGYAVAEDAGYLAALDTRLTDELIMEGLAREVVRRIQTMRKDAGFEIDDNIAIRYTANGRIAAALTQFSEYIRTETLGASLEQGEPEGDDHSESFTIEEDALVIGVRRIGG